MRQVRRVHVPRRAPAPDDATSTSPERGAGQTPRRRESDRFRASIDGCATARRGGVGARRRRGDVFEARLGWREASPARYAPAAELPRTSRGKSEREDPRVAHPKKTLGKKFNSRKEDVVGDTYLGIRKYRFYIKCCVCSNEIAFKTDPQNQDYVCESGATRNFESWRQQDDKEKEFEDEQKESNEQRGAARFS